MKLPEEIERVIARLVEEYGFTDPRTAGTPTVELVWRSLKLQLDIYEHAAERKRAFAGAKAVAVQLKELSTKAVDPEDVLSVEAAKLELRVMVDVELEQVRLDPRSGSREGKTFAGFRRERRRALRQLIEDIGGYAPDGGYAGDLLDFDPPHVERALELTRGEVEPDGEDEETALARWRERVKESPCNAKGARRRPYTLHL